MSSGKLDLATLNAMAEGAFVALLGDVYEHAEWVAATAARRRPFRDARDLGATMAACVREAGAARQLALLQAHPELGQRGALAPESAREQAEGGIDRLAGERSDRLASLNTAYRERFGFPFIVAVRGQRDLDAILRAAEVRLANTAEVERRVALAEVDKIAALRLARRFGMDDEAALEMRRSAP